MRKPLIKGSVRRRKFT